MSRVMDIDGEKSLVIRLGDLHATELKLIEAITELSQHYEEMGHRAVAALRGDGRAVRYDQHLDVWPRGHLDLGAAARSLVTALEKPWRDRFGWFAVLGPPWVLTEEMLADDPGDRPEFVWTWRLDAMRRQWVVGAELP